MGEKLGVREGWAGVHERDDHGEVQKRRCGRTVRELDPQSGGGPPQYKTLRDALRENRLGGVLFAGGQGRLFFGVDAPGGLRHGFNLTLGGNNVS